MATCFGGCFSDLALRTLYVALASGDYEAVGKAALLAEVNAILDTEYNAIRGIMVDAPGTDWEDEVESVHDYAPCAYFEFMNTESVDPTTFVPQIVKYAAIFYSE